ncbi:Uncharacterised protein [Mycobacterium tuberculosis]|nr:Uncharacterised protein [Mycobacterium tuberculosis]
MGKPESDAVIGVAVDASCTGTCDAGNRPTTAGGAVSLPIDTPMPIAAVGSADNPAAPNAPAPAPSAD